MGLEGLLRKTRGLAVAGLLSAVSLGCDADYGGSASIPDSLRQCCPIWSPAYLEINKMQGGHVIYDTQIFQKPEFYDGKMPLRIEEAKKPYPGISGTQTVLSQDLGDFANYFVYTNGILKGAVSVDEENLMVAEAKVRYEFGEGMPRMIAEEFHYKDGTLKFHCVSEYDQLGHKIGEQDKKGKKQDEYFFMLPR